MKKIALALAMLKVAFGFDRQTCRVKSYSSDGKVIREWRLWS